MRSLWRTLIVALLFTVAWSAKSCCGSPSRRNVTLFRHPDERDFPSFPEVDETALPERYRRLLPYMKFLVSGNYLGQQSHPTPTYKIRTTALPQLQRRPQPPQLYNLESKNTKHQYYVSPPIDREKFIPSPQYDPETMDNEDYFMPVRHDASPSFQDYRSPQRQRFQDSTPVRRYLPHINAQRPIYQSEPLPRKNVGPSHRPVALQFQDDSELPPSFIPQAPEDRRLGHIVKSFQLTNRLPEMLNADNIDDSIKTLVEILNLLNMGRKEERRPPMFTRPNETPLHRGSPYRGNLVDPVAILGNAVQLQHAEEPEPPLRDSEVAVEELEEPAVVLQDPRDRFVDPPTTEEPGRNYPQPDGVATHTQNFPPTSVKYGATRGKPNVDYPAYATIPNTDFSCDTQRYKGFFGDPQTGCQVWHYCDLNGGKSSFLCPNGTIFSQVALTCDWWFNVKCESTEQLYVLNERLYKYILPVMPKFPEDFTGPEVDRYLELKFKEMEAKMKEKKLKKHQEAKNKTKNSVQTDNDYE